MTHFKSRRDSRPRRRRNIFFLPDASRRYPRWKRHHPADDWTGLSSYASTSAPQTDSLPGFLLLYRRGRDDSSSGSDSNLRGKIALVLLALALLLIRIFC